MASAAAEAVEFTWMKRAVTAGYAGAGDSEFSFKGRPPERVQNADIVGVIEYPRAALLADPYIGAMQAQGAAEMARRYPKLSLVSRAAQIWDAAMRAAARTAPSAPPLQPVTQIRLKSGAVVSCKGVRINGDTISFETDSGVTSLSSADLAPEDAARFFGAALPKTTDGAAMAAAREREAAEKLKLRPVNYQGTLPELLTHLYLDYGIVAGIDPLTARAIDVTRTRAFVSNPTDTFETFLNRLAIAEGVDLVRQADPFRPAQTFFYFSDRKMLAIGPLHESFQAARYGEVVAAIGRSTASSPAAQSLARLSEQFLQLQQQTARDRQALQGLLTEIDATGKKVRFFGTNKQGRDAFGNLVDDASRNEVGKDFLARQEMAKKQVLDLFSGSIDTFLQTKELSKSLREDLALPPFTVEQSWLELLGAALAHSLNIVSRARPYFSEAAEVVSLLTREQSALQGKIIAMKSEREATNQIRQAGYALAAQGNIREAFAKLSAADSLSEGADPLVRKGLAVLAIQVKAEAVRSIVRENAVGGRDERLRQLLQNGRHVPAGLDEATVAKLAEFAGTPPLPAPRLTAAPSRVGVVDGLVVMSLSGAGKVAPKAITLEPKSSAPTAERRDKLSEFEKRLSTESADHDIAVHGGVVRLDASTLASIHDSLRYVSTTRVPDLYQRWRISIAFDQTVMINHGGDSAGSAFAIAAFSAARQKAPAAGLCLTGAIRPYGDITSVGGIYPKTMAAAKDGYQVMLAPMGNLADFQWLDFPQLGALQVIGGRTFDDYLLFAIPELSERPEYAAEVLRLYATSYVLHQIGAVGEARAFLERLMSLCPNHLSGAMMLRAYDLAKVVSAPLPDSLAGLLTAASPAKLPAAAQEPR